MQWKRHYFVDDLPIIEFGHHHDGAEGLLFGNEHVVLHISEHSGLHEEAWRTGAVLIISSC